MNFYMQLTNSSTSSYNHFKSQGINKSPLKKMQSKIQNDERLTKSNATRNRATTEYSSVNLINSHVGTHKGQSHANQWVSNSQFLSKTPQISPSHGANFTRANRKNPKYFQSISVQQNTHLNKSFLLQSSEYAKKKQINRSANLEQKSKTDISSKDPSNFWKRNTQKNVQNEEFTQDRDLQQNDNSKLLKIKSKNWQEEKNIDLYDNQNMLNQNRADITNVHIQIPLFPKMINLRKHSDNQSVKKVPSFLTSNKNYKNSIDLAQLMQRDQLGIDDFIKLKDLGKGAFGKVILAMEKQIQFICAIKIISKDCIRQDNMLEQLIRQVKIQMRINHPNIIKVYGFFHDSLNLYIVMECALDGQLSELIQKNADPIPQTTASIIFQQICQAVCVLHSESIIHRDLKPENVMIHEKTVKICDFGWSVYRGSSLRSTFCGTPIYLCPEILTGDEYDESIDIWALGVMLYQMLFKTNPFRITCRQELVNIINEPIYFNEQIAVSEAAKDIINICLSKRARERPNIRELLLHQFLVNVQSSNQYKR